jgi:hypothetical protein
LVIITINRPEQRNAVNRAVSYAVCAAMDEMDRNPALRAGILTGAGGNFCSGMDLKAFLRGEIIRVEGRGILGLARTPPVKPLIAAVEGYCLAGGFESMLCCDLAVVARNAQFGLPEAKRGLAAAERRHTRYEPTNTSARFALPGGREQRCEVIDISLSGAGLRSRLKPSIGSPVTLGRMKGRVVRHFADGFAIEFLTPLERSDLDSALR